MFSLRKWLATTASAGLVVGSFLSQASFSQAQEPRPSGLGLSDRGMERPSAVSFGDPAPPVSAGKPTLAPPAPPNAAPSVLSTRAGAAQGDKKPAPDAKPVDTLPPDVIYEDAPAQGPKSAWYDHPKVRTFPRQGWFIIQPKGCGYYSLADCVHGIQRKEHEKSGYPPSALMAPSFFDADFRYIDDPKRTDYDHFDPWHRIHLGDNWLFGTGGQAWWRSMNEINSRLSGKSNDYDLFRGRIFGDLWYKDQFRIFGEFISAWTSNQDLPPLLIDQNRADIQNLFVDVKLAEIDCNPVYLRVGRQELNFGSQRLISSLDWANTRRTFQGARLLYSSQKFDFDMFWVRPVIPNPTHFDTWDDKQSFAGAWGTYRPKKGQNVDLYYLYLDNNNTVTQKGLNLDPTTVHTVGSRYVGQSDDGFLWDLEGMFQAGANRGNNIRAGAATAGVGYHWKDGPMNPIFWAYYDWASGDSSPNKGDYNTFNQLFPFGHYYFGFLDLVARQNVRDWSLHTYFFPSKWITCNIQYHFMQMDKAADAIYSAGGAVLREAPKGNFGGTIGQELDLNVNFHINRHSDFMVGYSILQAGDFIRNTGNGRNPELTYFIYNFRW